MEERPHSTNIGNQAHQLDNACQKSRPKKVKVLCQASKENVKQVAPQPLLISSQSQKNCNMSKALQQINSMFQSSHQSSGMQSISQANLFSTQNNIPTALNHIQGLKNTQSTKNLKTNQQLQPITFIKSPQQPLKQNLINFPLNNKGQGQQKMKQLQAKVSGMLMHKCESHASLLNQKAHIGVNSKNNRKDKASARFSKKEEIRQNSIITNNSNDKYYFSSLSPQQRASQKNRVYQHSKPHYERVKSLDNQSLDTFQFENSQDFQSAQKAKRMTQQIRVSPQKQFIVPACTQQASPQEKQQNNGFKLQFKKNVEKSNNLILEEEDYQLPSEKEEQSDYSLNKDYKRFVNHDHKMTKNAKKEPEESMNQGFLTDRQQSSNNETSSHQEQQTTTNAKNKGMSYTKNVQELKKLLFDTGAVGNLGQASSQGTAMQMNSNVALSQNTEVARINQNKGKENQVFCFSARNRNVKSTIHNQNNEEKKDPYTFRNGQKTNFDGNLINKSYQDYSADKDQGKPPSLDVKRSAGNKNDTSSLNILSTDQFIHGRSNVQPKSIKFERNDQSNKPLTRCWTAQDHISSSNEKIENNSSNQNQDAFSNKEFKSSELLKQCKRQSMESITSNRTQQSTNLQKSIANGNHLSSVVSNEGQVEQQFDSRELEVLKFKMIAFVKSYENEFRKMKLHMNELQQENQKLKKKLNGLKKRRLSAAPQSQCSVISKTASDISKCPTSVHTFHNNV